MKVIEFSRTHVTACHCNPDVGLPFPGRCRAVGMVGVLTEPGQTPAAISLAGASIRALN
jgi:hypothetical protein